MQVDYRLMRPEDEDQTVTLWATTFGSNDPERARHYIRTSDPDYLNHTLVAVSHEGTVLTTLHYYPYLLRDAGGNPQRVGCVSHVATREDARRQGHAANILQLAFQTMHAEGCEWTLLFSSKMGEPLYERFDFKRSPLPFMRGVLTGHLPASPGHPYTINRLGQSSHQDWSFLAPIFDAYNSLRPLVRVRDDWYWQVYFPLRAFWTLPTNTITLYTATSPAGNLCAYLIATFSSREVAREQYNVDQFFAVRELCALPDHTNAIPALIAAVVEDTSEGEIGGRFVLPYEEPITSIARHIFGPTLYDLDDRNLYARPLSPHVTHDVTHDDIQAIFSAPGACFWILDDF